MWRRLTHSQRLFLIMTTETTVVIITVFVSFGNFAVDLVCLQLKSVYTFTAHLYARNVGILLMPWFIMACFLIEIHIVWSGHRCIFRFDYCCSKIENSLNISMPCVSWVDRALKN